MAVRGAPAIAVAGMLALAVELHNGGAGKQFSSADDAAKQICQRVDYLVTSRPTAVNLLDSSRKLRTLVEAELRKPNASATSVTAAVIESAEAMQQADIDANRAIGAHGRKAMLAAAQAAGLGTGGKLRVLTHCNTGSLATVQYGTALGCVRALHEAGQLEHAFCTETRPYNQGARLTAYELVTERIPATLIADSAAAALMAAQRVDAVVVGADRVAANGDTANKVGTCMLALAAAAHGIPFFVAAPTTSIDPAIASGDGIEIEERAARELTHAPGANGARVAAEGIGVWNPAFDVAIAAHITGIVTEKGLIRKSGAAFDIRAFFRQHGLPLPPATATVNGNAHGRVPAANAKSDSGFEALTPESVLDYVAARPAVARRVGPPASRTQWRSREVGDGNINFVYVVEGPAGGVVVKQGLPYVRAVGESWPLSQERLRYEAESLREMHRHCPAHVPQLYDFDVAMFTLTMQYLAPPHVVLRYGLLEGNTYPHVASQAAEHLACCLFRTSAFAMEATAFRALADRFSNPAMCQLTEQVIFTDPYYDAPHNRHTSPALDDAAVALRRDAPAKAAAAAAKAKFLTSRQALLHGDLHTGSCMVTRDTFYVIDSEFAFYGPMAFDVGKLIANVLLTFFALDGHSSAADGREHQRAYLLQVARDIWNRFTARFLDLWSSEGVASALTPAELFADDSAARVATQTGFMRALLTDAVLFGGCVMIRRLVGIAHNADFERIEDARVRGVCEMRALRLGRDFLVNAADFVSIEAVVEAAVAARTDGEEPCYPIMLDPRQ